MRKASVDGFNETLNGIKQSQQDFKDTQNHFITLTLFCDCGIENVYDMVSVKDVPELTMEEFQPCCYTPLLDANGQTITAMENHVICIRNSVVVVTIITDGRENASRKFNNAKVRQLIDRLKEKSWTFTFIGANQDSFAVASKLSIHQARTFRATPQSMTSVQQEVRAQNTQLFSHLDNLVVKLRNDMLGYRYSQLQKTYSAMSKAAFDSVPNTSASRFSMPFQKPTLNNYLPPILPLPNPQSNNSFDLSSPRHQLLFHKSPSHISLSHVSPPPPPPSNHPPTAAFTNPFTLSPLSSVDSTSPPSDSKSSPKENKN